jgi:uncharacterized repeat protein (TIGR03803 family)
MRRPLLIIVIVAVCACVSAPTIFAQNLLTNGSFETGDFTGWTTGGNFQGTQVVSGPFYSYSGAQDGNFYVAMGPVSSDGTLSQTLATIPGVQYTISFWFASVGDSPSDFSVYWNNTPLLSLSNPNTGATWTQFTFTVVATGRDTLLFSFRDDPAYMALDDVSLISTSNYACPASQTGFREIHDFGVVGINDPPSGVVLDQAGNLYGTLPTAGRYGAGLLYALGQRAGHWFYSPLYNFPGDSNGGAPGNVIVGPQGELYGSAAGGLYGYGLIFKATPPPNTCPNALCSWDVTTIYEFRNRTDAAGGTVTAVDSAGNLYGFSAGGGAYGAGAVFKVSPWQGGWTEEVLYSFTGGSDGGIPNSLVVGNEGNLYGTTSYGGDSGCLIGFACGVVFQLAPSGGGWTEDVLHAFTGGAGDGWSPRGLIKNQYGGFLGLSTCYIDRLRGGGCMDNGIQVAGVIFALGIDGGFSEYHIYSENECQDQQWDVTYHALAMDAAGSLYATEGGMEEGVGQSSYCGTVEKVTGPYSYTTLVSGSADIFYNLSSDANGKLYGTTSTCGFGKLSRTSGMVWQYSP